MTEFAQNHFYVSYLHHRMLPLHNLSFAVSTENIDSYDNFWQIKINSCN